MSDETVARSYAETLFELADRNDALEEYGSALETVARLIEEDDKFRLFLETPRIDDDVRKGVVREAFGGQLPKNVVNFVLVTIDKRRQRKVAVAAAMERCGVVEVRRKLVGHVSRGYRQRVGLADALVARPPILILDEPTSGLDPNQRRRMKALIRELAEEHTILFSSHILAEVGEVSGRILIIGNGRLRADGTIDELLRQAPGRCLVVSARADGEQLESIDDHGHC